MKRSLAKTVGSLFIAMVLCINTGAVAFATEIDSNATAEPEVTSTQNAEATYYSYGDYDMGEIPKKGNLTLYPTLNSYVGLTMTFFFTTDNIYSDTVPSGNIRVWVYKPNGKLLKFFTVKARSENYFDFTLPSSGTYKVVIDSDVNEKILASAGWTKR